jgi:hypothetical protein
MKTQQGFEFDPLYMMIRQYADNTNETRHGENVCMYGRGRQNEDL